MPLAPRDFLNISMAQTKMCGPKKKTSRSNIWLLSANIRVSWYFFLLCDKRANDEIPSPSGITTAVSRPKKGQNTVPQPVY